MMIGDRFHTTKQLFDIAPFQQKSKNTCYTSHLPIEQESEI